MVVEEVIGFRVERIFSPVVIQLFLFCINEAGGDCDNGGSSQVVVIAGDEGRSKFVVIGGDGGGRILT